jgi:hypothetical protein
MGAVADQPSLLPVAMGLAPCGDRGVMIRCAQAIALLSLHQPFDFGQQLAVIVKADPSFGDAPVSVEKDIDRNATDLEEGFERRRASGRALSSRN